MGATAALGCVLKHGSNSRPRLCPDMVSIFSNPVPLSGAPPTCISIDGHWRAVEVEPFCGRLSTQAKSRAKPRELRRAPTKYPLPCRCREFYPDLSPNPQINTRANALKQPRGPQDPREPIPRSRKLH